MTTLKTAFPLLQVDSPMDAAGFYERNFAFQRVFESDWYVQLRNGTQELAFISVGHESIPAARHGLSQNVCLTLEVADVDSSFERVKDAVEVVTEPRDETWGQRHFLGYDPSGIMLDVMEMRPNGT